MGLPKWAVEVLGPCLGSANLFYVPAADSRTLACGRAAKRGSGGPAGGGAVAVRGNAGRASAVRRREGRRARALGGPHPPGAPTPCIKDAIGRWTCRIVRYQGHVAGKRAMSAYCCARRREAVADVSALMLDKLYLVASGRMRLLGVTAGGEICRSAYCALDILCLCW